MELIDLSKKKMFRSEVKFSSLGISTVFPKVTREGDRFVIDEDIPQDSWATRTLSSYLNRVKARFTHFEMDRLPHELIMTMFSHERPRRISEVFPPRGDVHDGKTPDLIGDNFFFELGTSALGSDEAYTIKIKKYRDAARAHKVDYFVLGVGPGDTTANFELSDDENEKIVELYIMGRQIQQAASKHGFIMTRTDSDIEKTLKFSMKNISDKCPRSFLHIYRKDWFRWSRHLEDNFFNLTRESLSVYKKLVNKSHESIKAMREKMTTENSAVEDLKLKLSYEERVDSLKTRPVNDEKKLPIPFCAVEPGEFSFAGRINYDTPIGELWSSIKDKMESWPEPREYEDHVKQNKSIEEEVEFRMSKEHQQEIRDKNRIKIKLTEGSKRQLSTLGYLGKKYSKKKAENVQTSLGYSLSKEYDFTDLEEFLSADIMLTRHFGSEKFDLVEPLLLEGGFDKNSKQWNFFKDFMCTKLGHCCSFLSSLFSEINLNFKKTTKDSEFLLSRIPGYKAALLLHNTGSDKHTFYSVLVRKEDIEFFKCLRFFRDWIDVGDFYALNLSSTRRHDISNYLFCSSKVMTMLATHMEVFDDGYKITRNISCIKEFMFHTLVYLSNNNQVSEVLQQVRFFYMKTNCSKHVPEPMLSPVEKLPTVIRTRLCCFAIKRILAEFLNMSMRRKEISTDIQEKEDDEEENYSEDFVKGVHSYISSRPLRNYEQALLLSYGGIYHNKEKSDLVNSNLQIYRKLTKEELKLDKNLKENYLEGFEVEDSMDMPPHGFSGTHVRNCGLALLSELKKKGISFSDLKQRIAVNLDKVTFEELATFKASLESSHLKVNSTEQEFQEAYPDLKFDGSAMDVKGKYKYGKTCRALEGVLDVLLTLNSDVNVRPFHLFSDLVNECNKRGGIVAILFKKAQFGSVREIFILTMFARIVVKFVETIARTIAECCPNEYLTKGTLKMNSTPHHYKKVRSASMPGDVCLNMFDSLDCKTWCQNFTFPAFGNLFSVIFREWPEISECIRVVFNMASSKRHEMTKTLMGLFVTRKSVVSMEESMNVLKENFLGEEGPLSKGYHSIFVKNVSNFMQGIFHYTSTILHSSHLLMISQIMTRYLEIGETNIRSIIHTTKASSDDGSSMMTVILKEPSKGDVMHMKGKLLVSSEILMRSYPLACAWIGLPKSTRFVENGVEEFNSLWSFRNTVLSVPSKFTTAATSVKITRNSIERQRVDHNSLNACIENGCSMTLTKIVELACAYSHYVVVGLDSIKPDMWKKLASEMIKCPHPATWLYISSPKIVGPTLGFDSTLNRFLVKNQKGRRVQFAVSKLLAGEYDLKSGFMVQTGIVIGKTDKYSDFIKRTVKADEFERLNNMLDNDPSLMYRESASVDEVKMKILMKAKSPGAERSFIFEDESAMHSISSYLISSACLKVSTKKNGNWDRRKMSLPAFLSVLSNMLSEAEDINKIEPNMETLLDMTEFYTDNMIPIGRRRKLPVKVRFPKTRSESQISLASCVKFIWFSIQNGYLKEENEEAFTEYKELYFWLKDTFNETRVCIEELGVEGNIHATVNGLIRQESDLDRTVLFMHSGRKESSMIPAYLSCLEYCQEKNCRLQRPNEMFSKTELGQFIDIEQQLFPYVTIHSAVRFLIEGDTEPALDKCKEIIMNNSELFTKPRQQRELRFLPQRSKNLLAIGSCLADSSSENIEKVMLNFAHGYIITYVKAQEKMIVDGRTKWVGEGEFLVVTNFARFLIKCTDNVLTEISSSRHNEIVQHLNVLSKIFKNLGITDYVRKRNVDGLKVFPRGVYFTVDNGAPVKELTFSQDLRRLKYTTELELRRGSLLMKISCENRMGKFKSDPIRFRPSQPAVGEYRYKLAQNRAKRVLLEAAKRPSTDELREFCQNSLIDRLSRLKLFSRWKLEAIIAMMEKPSEAEIQASFEAAYAEFFSSLAQENFVEIPTIADLGPVSVPGQLELSVLSNQEFERILNEDIYADNVIDDADMFMEITSIDTQPTNYEDLVMWDDFIDKFKQMTRFTVSEVLRGDYFLPTSGRSKAVLEAMIELRVAPKPKEDPDEDSEDDLPDFSLYFPN